MFDFIRDTEYTHMPYITYGKTGEAVYFFCKQVNSFWKIFYCLDGENVYRLETGLPDDAIECSPTAEYENGALQISFIAGGAETDRTFYLYRMSGIDGKAEKLERADYGYYWTPRTVYGLRSNSFVIRDSGRETKYTLPQAEYIYRLSYIPEDPNQILITGKNLDDDFFTWIYNLNSNEIYAVVADGISAYKACFFKGRCWYASRNDAGEFEERHIVEANSIQYIQIDSSSIVVEEVEKSSMACPDCLRKHLSAALSYAKEVCNGHGAGATPDHRCDLEGELVNAEHHAEALSESIAERIRACRKSLEVELFQPNHETLDTIRTIWTDTYNINVSKCNCNKG